MELMYSVLFVLIFIIMLKWLLGKKVKDSGNDLNIEDSKSPIKIEQDEVQNEPPVSTENDSVKPGSKRKPRAKRQLQRDTDESSTETESESEKIRKDGKSRKVSLRSQHYI